MAEIPTTISPAEPTSAPTPQKVSFQLLEEAITIAARVHRGQRDKGGLPYLLHPIRVMLQVKGDLTAQIVAMLHDVVEDSDTTLADLSAAGFPNEVLDAVALLTRPEGGDYFDYVARICGNPVAKKVKEADLRDNGNLMRLPSLGERDLERLAKYHRAMGILRERS